MISFDSSMVVPSAIVCSEHALPESVQSNSPKMKKVRLQHYVQRLKKVLAEYESMVAAASTSSPPPKHHLTTFEAFEKAICLIRESTAAVLRTPESSKASPVSWSPDATNTAQMPSATTFQSTAGESSPPSPAASSTSTSSVEQPVVAMPAFRSKLLPPVTSEFADRLWGTVRLSLPDGIVSDLSSCGLVDVTPDGLPDLAEVLPRGSNMLELLQGKGAQTLLLNAFCGHPKRRMYARLICGASVRPFELQCEFSPDERNPSVCSALIQILRLESVRFHNSHIISSKPTVFTTRHNASCAIIYLDSESIPYLGHFPSEISGKSIFHLIHADDVSLIQLAHKQLHSSNGRLVSTPNLRLVSYTGAVILVDSEWSAFVNPWTRSIEMIVGRHCISPKTADFVSDVNAVIPCERFRQLDASIHCILARPVEAAETSIPAETCPQNLKTYIDNVVESLVEKQQMQEEIKASDEAAPILSYNQINCLENVHRLLKSQSRFFELTDDSLEEKEEDDAVCVANSIPLTREILKQHNRKWEAECKSTWKKRLSGKRHHSDDSPARPAKTPRIRSDPQAYSISTAPLPPQTRPAPPPLPCPAPTPLDHVAWSEYVRIVQLHLQNMATYDRANCLRHHQQQQQQQHIAALAMGLQQHPSASSSPFNPLPSV